MALRGDRLIRMAVPIRALAQRFGFVLLLMSAVGLLVISKADVVVGERLRGAVADLMAPVLTAVAHPAAAVRHAVDDVAGLLAVHADNTRLRDENARLLHWQEVARRLEQDNAALRQLLATAGDNSHTFISARVIGDSGGPFVRTMLMNAGSRDDVQKGLAVVADRGLVGRVAESGQRSARILLLTDLNSRIPVMVENSRYRAVLAGDNSDMPRLEFLPSSAQLAPGDRIVTSGDGGVFPPGLTVGVVAQSGERGVRVRPFVDFARLEFVRVLRYDAPALLRAEPSRGGRSK